MGAIIVNWFVCFVFFFWLVSLCELKLLVLLKIK